MPYRFTKLRSPGQCSSMQFYKCEIIVQWHQLLCDNVLWSTYIFAISPVCDQCQIQTLTYLSASKNLRTGFFTPRSSTLFSKTKAIRRFRRFPYIWSGDNRSSLVVYSDVGLTVNGVFSQQSNDLLIHFVDHTVTPPWPLDDRCENNPAFSCRETSRHIFCAL